MIEEPETKELRFRWWVAPMCRLGEFLLRRGWRRCGVLTARVILRWGAYYG